MIIQLPDSSEPASQPWLEQLTKRMFLVELALSLLVFSAQAPFSFTSQLPCPPRQGKILALSLLNFAVAARAAIFALKDLGFTV
jgi:hypothetical protein